MRLDWSFHARANLTSPPTPGSQTVYLAARQNLFRLDLEGREVWKVRLPRATSGRPVPWRDRLLVSCEDGKLHHFSATDGSLLESWELGFPAGREPAVEGDFVVATCGGTRPGQGGGAVTVFSGDGGRLWRFSHDGGFHCTAALDEKRVYCGNRDHVVRALDRRDGSLLWGFATGHEVLSTPRVAGDRVLVTSNDGKLYCLDPRDGGCLWARDFGDAFYDRHPVVEGELVFVSGAAGVHCLDLFDGRVRWEFPVEGAFTSALWEGTLVFGAGDGGVYGLDPRDGRQLWRWPSPKGPGGQQFSDHWTRPVALEEKLLVSATFTQVLYCLAKV